MMPFQCDIVDWQHYPAVILNEILFVLIFFNISFFQYFKFILLFSYYFVTLYTSLACYVYTFTLDIKIFWSRIYVYLLQQPYIIISSYPGWKAWCGQCCTFVQGKHGANNLVTFTNPL
jgi:hypothetical protein